MAQVVPDICPREKEFAGLMKGIREDLVKIVHGDPKEYTSVLFCGSGTINIDICINSLLPEGKKVLVIDNGAYSTRAVEICSYYGLPHIDLKFPVDQRPDLAVVEETLKNNPDIGLVHTTHNETGTGILNPIREIGALVHKYGAIFTVDTTSTYAMRPIHIKEDNIDFCMASAQKGLMAMTGLSFVIGNRAIIEKSKDYPKRSYYCNLFLQYDCFEKTGEMHFTPPVQTIYATLQALKEYLHFVGIVYKAFCFRLAAFKSFLDVFVDLDIAHSFLPPNKLTSPESTKHAPDPMSNHCLPNPMKKSMHTPPRIIRPLLKNVIGFSLMI